MYHSNYDSDSGLGSLILKGIACIVLILIISAASRSCSRSNSDMIYIQTGYCYDENTMIIYKESIVGRYDDDTTYSVYYDKNGYICKYNAVTGEWEEVINEKK